MSRGKYYLREILIEAPFDVPVRSAKLDLRSHGEFDTTGLYPGLLVELRPVRSKRPTWDQYFLDIANVVATRSPDDNTKHGCVLVDLSNKIIGTGYNGHPRGMDKLPTDRPNKYPWMIHAERNAILNLTVPSRYITAYITGEPCFDCLVNMYQAGVTRIVHNAAHGSLLITEDERLNKKKLIKETGLKYEVV